MSVFYHEEPHTHHSKKCKFLAAALKDAFTNCHNFNGRVSTSGPEEENQANDFEEEQEVVVSEIRTRAMEKLKRRPSLIVADSFSWVFSPRTRDLYLEAEQQQKEEDDEEEGAREEYFSVGSCFSCCSSAMTREAYHSVRTNFSHCSSLNGLDFQDFCRLDLDSRRAIIKELCYCEGWPFGLCRRAVLLPPLPKSPSESWSWRKGTRLARKPRMRYV